MPVVHRYRFIRAEKANYPILILCRVLQVVRSAWYAWCGKEVLRDAGYLPDPDAAVRVHLRAIHKESRETYGYPRLTAALRQRGFVINFKRVARLMKEEGLKGLPARPRRRKSEAVEPEDAPQALEENVLNREFSPKEPNEVWASDITYLETGEGWMYLAVVVDLYARKVVGAKVSGEMGVELPLSALEQAMAVRKPKKGMLHHSDRGSQYRSRRYRAALEARGVRISMSRPGKCCDNAVVESFFGTMKNEIGRKWETRWTCEKAVMEYINEFYNPKRLHGYNGQQSPDDKERAFRSKQR